MLRLLHEIQGMQVVSLAEGRILGAVQKVFLNPTHKVVSGILVRQTGLGRHEGWVDIKDVSMIGEEVVFIAKASAYKAKAPVGRSLKDLMGMPVLTKEGKLLGSLVDVEVDAKWQVVELSLSEGKLIQIDPLKAVFGQDSILLKVGADKKVRSTPNRPGFLARLFGSQSIEEAADAISRAERSRKPTTAKRASKKTKKKTKKKTAKKTTKKTASPAKKR